MDTKLFEIYKGSNAKECLFNDRSCQLLNNNTAVNQSRAIKSHKHDKYVHAINIYFAAKISWTI